MVALKANHTEEMHDRSVSYGELKHVVRSAPPARRAARILVAEDDFEMRRFLISRLRKDGYDVTEAADGAQLLTRLNPGLSRSEQFDLDLIISDIRMPGVSGLEVLAGLRTYAGAPPVILITAFGNPETHAEAERLGAVAVFDKPFDVDAVRAFVRGALNVHLHGGPTDPADPQTSGP